MSITSPPMAKVHTTPLPGLPVEICKRLTRFFPPSDLAQLTCISKAAYCFYAPLLYRSIKTCSINATGSLLVTLIVALRNHPASLSSVHPCALVEELCLTNSHYPRRETGADDAEKSLYKEQVHIFKRHLVAAISSTAKIQPDKKSRLRKLWLETNLCLDCDRLTKLLNSRPMFEQLVHLAIVPGDDHYPLKPRKSFQVAFPNIYRLTS
jgi:hypothetical protein